MLFCIFPAMGKLCYQLQKFINTNQLQCPHHSSATKFLQLAFLSLTSWAKDGGLIEGGAYIKCNKFRLDLPPKFNSIEIFGD